ncbi:MAG: nuclear transport factor 2 family protein [Solirubrobacterales bacterium]
MSEENVELVRKGFAAFARGDPEGLKALCHPDVTWYPALGPVLEQSSYHGPDAVCRLLFEEIPSVLEGYRAETLGLEDLGDAVLAIVRFAGTSASTGLPVEQTFFQLFRHRNRKMIEMRGFTSREKALEAAGLSE